MNSVYIGLGSNIDPEENLRFCAKALRKKWPKIRFSSVLKTVPLEHLNQPHFLNAVATFETEESPESIMDFLESVEISRKKSTPFRFGPRTLDLDLLLYGDRIIPDRKEWKINLKLATPGPTLFIPHLRLHRRRFVLQPLVELIGPEAVHPVFKKTFYMYLVKAQDQKCIPDSMKL